MMDYTLPISKRTRLREAEVYKKLHDEIRKGRNQGKESNAAATGSTNGLTGAQEESGGGLSYKGSKSPVVLDDSEDDAFLDDCEKGGLEEGLDVVSLDDSDDDEQSEGVESKSFDVGGKKSGGTDVGGSCSGVESDGEESGRSKVPLPRWHRIVNESYNGDVFAHERNEAGVCFLSSGIGNGSGGVGLKGRESNGVAGRTELQSGFFEENKDGNVVVVVVDDDDDDACIILEKDAEELQSSSSGEEETFKDDEDDEDHRVQLPESFMVEEEETEEDGDREQGEMELKRNEVYGIEVLCDSDIGKIENNDVDMDDSLCVAKRTRSHYNLESAEKRMKLETVSRPLCVDDEKLDDNGDNDEDDTETYEAVDVAQNVRSKKGKTKPTGGNGDDVDDGDETVESRKGSRDEHGHGVCRRKPSKRRRKEYEVVKILANSIFLDQEDVPFKEEREPLEVPVLPLKFTFGIEESSPPVKSEEEKQLEELWADMALALCLKDTTDDAAVCCHR